MNVIDSRHLEQAPGGKPDSTFPEPALSRLAGLGEMTGEGGSGPRRALDRDPPAMQFDQRLDEGEPETSARTLLATEAIEDAGLDVEWDPAAGVGNLDADLAERPLGRDHDAS